MAREKFSTKEVIAAIEAVGPIQIQIAKYLGCHRNTVTNYIKRHPTIRQAYEEAGDMVESQAFKRAAEGYWPAIQFLLATKYKDRGFTTRTEHDLSGEHQAVVEETLRLDLSDLTDEELGVLARLADALEARGQSVGWAALAAALYQLHLSALQGGPVSPAGGGSPGSGGQA